MSDYGADPVPDKSKIRTVAFNYALAPKSNLKVDQFSTADTKKVYHLVAKFGQTRLNVLVEPADTPG